MTLADLREPVEAADGEVIVVDASAGRLDHIRDEFSLRTLGGFRPLAWKRHDFPTSGIRGIRAARGDIIVFTDAWMPSRGPVAIDAHRPDPRR